MDTSLFTKDITDLFDRKRGGHVEQWLYAGKEGSDYWRSFVRAGKGKYYIPDGDIRLIEYAVKALSEKLKDVQALVDFGVGGSSALRSKIFPIIDGCSNITLYVPVDLSKSFLENAQNYMSKEKPSMNVHPCNDNFFTNQFTIPGSNRLAVLFGSTITNIEMMEGEPFPRHKIIRNLRNLRNLTGNDNQMLISFDANSNLKNAFGAYEGAHWERFVTNLVHIIDKELKPGEGFIPKAWEFDAVLDKTNHAIHHCLQTTKRQNFSIGQKSYTFEPGERFVAINTLKYPVPLFQNMCREAGFEVNDLLHLEGNEMRLQHLYC